MADTIEKTIAGELREAAARLRSSKIDLATIEGLPEVVRVGGVPLARCVKCDCVARVEGEAVYGLLVVALLNAREPLASWLKQTASDYEAEVGPRVSGRDRTQPFCDRCGLWLVQVCTDQELCSCWDGALAVARVLNGGDHG